MFSAPRNVADGVLSTVFGELGDGVSPQLVAATVPSSDDVTLPTDLLVDLLPSSTGLVG